ncbi:MADS-box transcription factor 5-like, partial [Spinacia oleracea]|uniref:MADS-box transcription factor 5-like n=1 Tax=Spinacia oleracea TaxID=3562 RepID=A0ABM3QWM7_SPIOL
MRMLGKDLSNLSLKEVQQLEKQLSESLLSVKAKKDQLLMEQPEHSRRQIYELRGFHTPSERPKPMYLEYYPIATKVSSATNGTSGSDGGCNSEFDKTYYDVTLHLGQGTPL